MLDTSGECYSCRSLSGQKRISPGPPIFEGQFWVVEHAYPCARVGWLVIVLKRHAAALHELTQAEFGELAELQGRGVRLLRALTDCEKEYSLCFAELEHFNHIHFHLVAKPYNADELKGVNIFKLLKVSPAEAVAAEEVIQFCQQAARQF